ncbi:MAG: hypothetical protein Q7S33_00955 [Nanoarchaeota archaeon]|nr:hypothetical protein [Nanoarchaeota archaeon]
MELIAKITKGINVDQIYISKKRAGFPIGEYVKIISISNLQDRELSLKEKPFFYGLNKIEPIKIKISEEIFDLIENEIETQNVIITGSFLDIGFNFKDLDILIVIPQVKNEEHSQKIIIEKIINNIGIQPHIIFIDNKSLIEGLSTDPLYQSMLSKCVSKKRIIYKIETKKINYKLLDLQLLKSKIVFDNYDSLTGEEKYYYLQNMMSIYLFLKLGRITKDNVESEIKKNFEDKKTIKYGCIDKKEFLKKYKKIYNQTFDLIIDKIKKQDAK